jgi:hypothetical protein
MSETHSVDIYEVASHLWDTADELRANSHLKAAEYSIPVLGLIFLKFGDSRFTEAEAYLAGKSAGRRVIGKADCLPQSSSNPCWSNFRVLAFSVIVRTTSSGTPDGTSAEISSLTSTTASTRETRCLTTSFAIWRLAMRHDAGCPGLPSLYQPCSRTLAQPKSRVNWVLFLNFREGAKSGCSRKCSIPDQVGASASNALGRNVTLAASFQSPLTDSNRRPPPYHGGSRTRAQSSRRVC